ncbi:MAG: hypothetical protein GY906_23770 [bacterium]|nr:hypothetical protein [bacterium]
MSKATYISVVKSIRLLATEKWGKENISRPKGASGSVEWLLRQGPSDHRHPKHDDPLFWRLDTWLGGVNAYCTFDLDEPLYTEAIEARFKGVEVALEACLEKTTV